MINGASILRITSCVVGGALMVCSVVVLACIDQDDARHSFGHAGGALKIYHIIIVQIGFSLSIVPHYS